MKPTDYTIGRAADKAGLRKGCGLTRHCPHCGRELLWEMVKKIKCDIQCSNCGKRTELTNTVGDAVRVIKNGWDSIGGALYCPDCVNKITNNGYANRLAGEKNTFIVIMNWLLREVQE